MHFFCNIYICFGQQVVQYDFTTIYQLGNAIRYQAHPLPETESILCPYMNCIVYLSDVISGKFFNHVTLSLRFLRITLLNYVIGISILFENINLVFLFQLDHHKLQSLQSSKRGRFVASFHHGRKPEKLPKVNALNELIPMLSLKDVQIAAAQDFWGTDALYVSWIFSKCTDFCS